MLNLLTPIEETRAYPSIFAEGEVIGEAKDKAGVLQAQLPRRFGVLPTWTEGRIEAAPLAQLDASSTG